MATYAPTKFIEMSGVTRGLLCWTLTIFIYLFIVIGKPKKYINCA